MSKIIRDKPIIEAAINGAALTLISFGVLQIQMGSPHFPRGYMALFTGVFLEWFKYYGRKNKWW